MAQRIKTLADATALMRHLSHDQIGGDLPPALAGRLSAPRYRARLERRFLRRTGAVEAMPALFESPVPGLVALGQEGMSRLILDTGAMCQYAVLRRIVDKAVLADLSKRLGIALATHDARRATQGPSIDSAREIAAPVAPGGDVDAIIEAILRDGTRCWSCWVHGQPAALHRFLHALVPSSGTDGTTEADGTNVAGDRDVECRPRECRRRADLFVARLDLALAEEG